MKKLSRSLIATAAGAALLGLSACGTGSGSGGGNTEAPETTSSQAGLASFDPCTFFQPDQLTSFGLGTQSEPFAPVSYEPGCRWTGEKFILSLQKNAEETVASYETTGSWDSYTKKTIAGRSAAVALESGATGVGSCSVLVDAGGGVAIFMLDGQRQDSVPDPCGETEKIVSQVASQLPK
ncbi:DUF3558 family protein [Saccharopolyspora flava]|uniref:DUF3558 family protein n=1 Tax=Saccharopolyspora flava TaxID=95161 RepID=UPI000B8111BA|nr:DUF3558 family protein [Saccharopolyspora flava]